MKRIYMISSQLMFSLGIQTMLSGQPGIDIVGRETDVARAMEQIGLLRPDVVILDSKDLKSIPNNLVATILRESPGTKVISLNLENDRMRIYHGELRVANNLDDLLQVIENHENEPLPVSFSEWQALAIGRKQVYSFLASIYSGEIEELLLEDLPYQCSQLIGSLEHGEDLTGDLRQGIRALSHFQQGIKGFLLDDIKTRLAEEYARLLQGERIDGWLTHACESAYMEFGDPCADELIPVLNGTYYKAGWKQTARMLAQPDFIACEMAFMQYLCANEQLAWVENNYRQASVFQQLQCAFLRNHLVRWIPRFCDFLLMQTKHDFFRAIAFLTRSFILNEAYRVAELMDAARLAEQDWDDNT